MQCKKGGKKKKSTEDPAAAGDVWDYEGFLDQFLE
jgi:hypothetical protein